VFFIDTAKFSGKKHLRAGECQGAKKNEEKDTKKRKPRLTASVSKTFNPRARKASPLHFRRGRLYSSKYTITMFAK
jgi:hypothetical protein